MHPPRLRTLLAWLLASAQYRTLISSLRATGRRASALWAATPRFPEHWSSDRWLTGRWLTPPGDGGWRATWLRAAAEARDGVVLATVAVLTLTLVMTPFLTGTPTSQPAEGSAALTEGEQSVGGSGSGSGEQGAAAERGETREEQPRSSRANVARTRQQPPPGKVAFGAEPLRYVQQAAADAAKKASCGINANQATALTLAPTWPETSPEGKPPSPMTLSRWDLQRSLGDPQRRAYSLWFYPGIGPWQLDSAGIGRNFTAAEAMDTKRASQAMAPYIVGRYCGARKAGASEAGARRSAWRDWYACDSGACERAYRRALSGVVAVEGIGRYGGGQQRTCEYRGKKLDCLYVDPKAAEGANWWVGRTPGAAPAPSPFYVMRVKQHGGDREVRYWLSGDSRAPLDVSASRPLGRNARGGLSWSIENSLCDRTASRGNCRR